MTASIGRRSLALLGAALGFSGSLACGHGATQATATAPTLLQTSAFDGTVQPESSDVHVFTVATTGQVSATLTTASPPATIVMGLAIGIPSDDGCAALAGASTTTAAGDSPQVSGILSPNDYCVTVYDAGNQTQPVSYSVSVTHP